MLLTRFRSLLVTLFLAALAVRLFGLNWDSGHWFHPDERRIAEAVQQIHLRPLQLDPKFFAYGSFPFYVTRAVQGAVSLAVPSLEDYRGSILVGRGVSALWGALTVALLALLGRRLYGERTGLLAGLLLSAAVLHLQNSHFATNDVPLTFLVLLALSLLIRAGDSGSARDFGLAGLVMGLAAATKVSALPLVLPLLVATWAFRPGETVGRRLRLAGLAIAATVAGFALGEPYALLDFRAFSHDVLEQSRMVRAAGELAYTTQYVGTPKVLYELREHLFWGLGPFLGLAGLWGALRTYRFRSRRVSAPEWVLLSFALPFFAVTASFDVKFLRYLLPLYPLVCLWAARWLSEAGEDEVAAPPRPGRRILRGAVVGATVLYAASFLAIYTRPHTAVAASRWFYANVAKGSAVLSQDWDEGFPFDLDGRSAGEYRITNFSFYEPDTPEKVRKLAGSLCISEVAVFQTKRLYGAITQAPGKYPRTDQFFRLLFAGDLGFQLEKEVVSRPGFFGQGLLDELADESFSVYDHPKVVVFRNRERLSAAEIESRILAGSPSRLMTRAEILIAPHGVRKDEAPALARRSGAEALALLLLFAEALGLAGYAALRRFLPPRPGLYALGKITGVLLFSFGAWLVVVLGAAPFTRPLLLAVAVAVAAAGIVLFAGRVGGSVPLREVAWTEGAVWGSFLFFVLVRAGNPEIFWGEKPMDFSFLNLLYRTTSLPPVEPWCTGTPLSYTYFGHFSVAALGKALAIPPPLMFNLGIALVASLAAAGLFAAGATIGNGLGTGLLATALGLFAGNLSGIRELAARKVVNFDTFWATSRCIPDTINEYPFWSFLFADLHAHVLAVPFALGLVALLLQATRASSGEDASPSPGIGPKVATGLFAALFLGATAVTNGWGTPTWAALSFVLLAASIARPRSGALRARLLADGAGAAKAAAAAAAILAGALLLFRPFWASFSPPARQMGWEHGPYAGVWDVFNHFGLFFLVLVPFLFLVLWRSFGAGRNRPPAAALVFLAAALLLVPATLVAW
jgi:4-amino-4-deoxy-L-arabinose transferase-like glycosyltransferase